MSWQQQRWDPVGNNMQPNIQHNMQHNIQANIQSMPPNIQPNIQHNIQPNVQPHGMNINPNQMPINQYRNVQYENMTPEQQYIMQQNWQQWTTYQQQYAQWQAQYGEQYQLELQQKLANQQQANVMHFPNVAVVPPVITPVAALTPVAPMPATVFVQPPPPPPPPEKTAATNVQSLIGAVVEKPLPPVDNIQRGDIGTNRPEQPINLVRHDQPIDSTQTVEQSNFQQAEYRLQSSDGLQNRNSRHRVDDGNQQFNSNQRQSFTGNYGEKSNYSDNFWKNTPVVSSTPQMTNQPTHQRVDQRQRFDNVNSSNQQPINLPTHQRADQRHNFDSSNSAVQQPINKQTQQRDDQRQFYDNLVSSMHQPIQQRIDQRQLYDKPDPSAEKNINYPSQDDRSPEPDIKSPEEIAFDDQFRKWEDQFIDWKRQNANHPDRVAYHDYERKMEECRSKLLERREQMRRRKIQQKQTYNETKSFGRSNYDSPNKPSTNAGNFKSPNKSMQNYNESKPYGMRNFDVPNEPSRNTLNYDPLIDPSRNTATTVPDYHGNKLHGMRNFEIPIETSTNTANDDGPNKSRQNFPENKSYDIKDASNEPSKNAAKYDSPTKPKQDTIDNKSYGKRTFNDPIEASKDITNYDAPIAPSADSANNDAPNKSKETYPQSKPTKDYDVPIEPFKNIMDKDTPIESSPNTVDDSNIESEQAEIDKGELEENINAEDQNIFQQEKDFNENPFFKSSQSSAGGIPGLDLVTNTETTSDKNIIDDLLGDEIDLDNENRRSLSVDEQLKHGGNDMSDSAVITPNAANDKMQNLDAISKGINNILGDKNLLSLLSNLQSKSDAAKQFPEQSIANSQQSNTGNFKWSNNPSDSFVGMVPNRFTLQTSGNMSYQNNPNIPLNDMGRFSSDSGGSFQSRSFNLFSKNDNIDRFKGAANIAEHKPYGNEQNREQNNKIKSILDLNVENPFDKEKSDDNMGFNNQRSDLKQDQPTRFNQSDNFTEDNWSNLNNSNNNRSNQLDNYEDGKRVWNEQNSDNNRFNESEKFGDDKRNWDNVNPNNIRFNESDNFGEDKRNWDNVNPNNIRFNESDNLGEDKHNWDNVNPNNNRFNQTDNFGEGKRNWDNANSRFEAELNRPATREQNMDFESFPEDDRMMQDNLSSRKKSEVDVAAIPDEYYRPAQIIDYSRNSTKSITEEEQVLNFKLIDYSHDQNRELYNNNTCVDYFRPILIVDYGHGLGNNQNSKSSPNSNIGRPEASLESKPTAGRLQQPSPVHHEIGQESQQGPVMETTDLTKKKGKRKKNKKKNAVKESNPSYPGPWVLNDSNRAKIEKPTKRGKRKNHNVTSRPNAWFNSIKDDFEDISDGDDDLNSSADTDKGVNNGKKCNIVQKDSTAGSNPQTSVQKPVKSYQPIHPSDPNIVLIENILLKPGRDRRPPKIVIIMRGPPGSGKTYLAKLIKDKEIEFGKSAPRILSIDDYYMTEVEVIRVCPNTKRKILTKNMEYIYESAMEGTYMQYLIKSFKKTVTGNLFNFIIIDCINSELADLTTIYNFAKINTFTPYICELTLDLNKCVSQNIHNRAIHNIKYYISNWQKTPESFLKLNCDTLINSTITNNIDCNTVTNDINMEDVSNDEDFEDSDVDNELQEFGFIKSKWDADTSDQNLARLDGIPKVLRHHSTIEDYLHADEWDDPPNDDKKKRVRWADIEAKKNNDKKRALGFVVGQTDWKCLMDDKEDKNALLEIKYFPKDS